MVCISLLLIVMCICALSLVVLVCSSTNLHGRCSSVLACIPLSVLLCVLFSDHFIVLCYPSTYFFSANLCVRFYVLVNIFHFGSAITAY